MDPFRSLFNAASSEKEDLMCLNERLGDLLMKIEKLRTDSGKLDNSEWLRAIACLEEEIKKLKAFYETELSKTRSPASSLLSPSSCSSSSSSLLQLSCMWMVTIIDIITYRHIYGDHGH